MAVERTIDLSAKQRKTVLALLQRHLPGTVAWVYGSRAKWTSRPHSDLDLVVFATPEQQRAVSDLREAFEESNLPFRVDLFVWNEIPDSFRKQIERDHVVLVPPGTNNVPPQPKEPAKDATPQQSTAREKRLKHEHEALERSVSCRGWRKVSIGEIADIVGGGTPSTKKTNNFDGVIPWLTPKDLSGNHDRYMEGGERNLSQQGLDSSSAKLLPAGSVLLSTRAPIGYVALAKNPITTNQGFRNLVVRDGVCPEYLYYWLKLNTEELERHASGSTFRELSGSSLKKIKLSLPTLPEQHAIAHILGTLDDKIELNRRMNETLEAMARALFKSWFVDFDPVRAKMALNQQAAQHHHSPPQEEPQHHHSMNQGKARHHHSPLEGESASGGRQPAGAPVGGNSPSAPSPAQTGAGGSATFPPPHQPSPDGSASATPPQGGSDRNVLASGGRNDWASKETQWQQIKRQYSQRTRQQAQTLRKNQTNAEGLLWHYLRNKQLGGHKFRRQQSIGPYIADFACMTKKLLIELDGGQHSEQRSYDQKRDAFLRGQGYNILRFWNNEVFENCLGVLQRIHAALNHHPSPQEEHANHSLPQKEARHHHSPLEGESASGGRQPAGAPVGGNSPAAPSPAETVSGAAAGFPPPHQLSPDGSASATPPQGGSDQNALASEDQNDWTPERARAYLDGMDPEIIDLFPDALDADGKPMGWDLKTLDTLFDIKIGRTPPRKEKHHFVQHRKGVTWLSIKVMGDVQTFATSSEENLTYEAVERFRVPIIDAGTVMVSFKLTVGRVAIAAEEMCSNEAIAQLRSKIDTPISFPFTYCFMKAFDYNSLGSTSSIATAVNSKTIKAIKMIVPNSAIQNKFESIVQPIFDQILRNIRESDSLTSIRNALLPKLMSGEIRLHETEDLMEKAI